MSNVPSDLLYTKEHEWVRIDGNTATVGISHFAQTQLGDVVFVELPDVGKTFEIGESFGTVESVKAVSEIYAPLSGSVAEINNAVIDAPELVNEDPYGDGWLAKFEFTTEPSSLLSAADYEQFIKEEADK
ncbi:glycine cleavage system protein GcvH [Herpetosiphon llansteffanensis]